MTAALADVDITANFEANLRSIRSFWAEQNAEHVYIDLLDKLDGVVTGNLERHPRIGRDFFARNGQSLEVRQRVGDMLLRFGHVETREYLSDDYLILYCLTQGNTRLLVSLLAIRHHRQVSFDMEGFLQA